MRRPMRGHGPRPDPEARSRFGSTSTVSFQISSCFFGPRPWHIEIRHLVKQNKTSTINLFVFETLKLKIRRLKLWKPTVPETGTTQTHPTPTTACLIN